MAGFEKRPQDLFLLQNCVLLRARPAVDMFLSEAASGLPGEPC